MNCEVSLDFGLINREVEVLFSNNFGVGLVGEGFLIELVFEILKDKFLLDNLVDAVLDSADFGDVVLIGNEGSESTTLLVLFLQVGEVTGL